MTGGLFFRVIHKCENVVGCTFQYTAEPLDRDQCDVLVPAEAFQQAFFDAAIDKLILGDPFVLHSLPEGAVVNQPACLLSVILSVYYRFLHSKMIWSIYAP